MTALSVIIPTLNEAGRIELVLDHALAPAGLQPEGILVVDGGSSDQTAALARRRVPVVTTNPGRAHQMNTGARLTAGDWLLFCHGDSLLPPTYVAAIRAAFADDTVVAGAFTPRYQPAHPWLTLAEWLLRLPTSRLFFGDSAFFFRRSCFEDIGGFPEVPLLEDVAVIQSIQHQGRVVRVPDRVTTSSRRFMERGVLRQLLLDLRILIGFHLLGRSPWQLAPTYLRTERDRPSRGSDEQ